MRQKIVHFTAKFNYFPLGTNRNFTAAKISFEKNNFLLRTNRDFAAKNSLIVIKAKLFFFMFRTQGPCGIK